MLSANVVGDGGGSMSPTEESHFTRRELWMFPRQTPVKQDMKVEVPEEVFGVKRRECTVESNANVATFIKELTQTPEGENVDFRAGGYVQLECPAHTVNYSILILKNTEVIGSDLDFSSTSQWLRSPL